MAKREFPRVEQIDATMCGPACVEMMLRYYDIALSTGTFKKMQEKIADFDDYPVTSTANLTNLSKDPDQQSKDPWFRFVTRPVEIVNMFQGLANEVSDTKKKEALSKLGMNYFSDNAIGPDGFSLAPKAWEFLAHLAKLIQHDDHPPVIIPAQDASHWVVLYEVTVNSNKKEGNGRWKFKGKDPIQYSEKKNKNSPTAGIITISDSYLNFENPVNLVCIEMMPGNSDVLWLNSRQMPKVLPVPVLRVRLPGPLVPAATILNLVNRDMGAEDLNANVRHRSALKIGTPKLVQRLDRVNYDYYLIPILNEKGETVQLIRRDALTGEFLDSLQIDPTELEFDINTSTSGTQNVQRGGGLPVLPKIAPSELGGQPTVKPQLVWQPSLESLSAFYPFHQEAPKVFRRIDGKKFTGPLTAPIKTGKQVLPN